MKFLLVSDLHGQRNTLGYLKKAIELESPDAVILSGDLTTYDETDFVETVFGIFSDSRIPCFMIWGNCDMQNVRAKILSSKYNIHLKSKNIRETKIFGIADTDDLPAINPKLLAGAILVTHRPPIKGALDRKYAGAPKFHICGHIHNIARQTDYPSTSLVQVPSLTLGRYGLLDTKAALARFNQI